MKFGFSPSSRIILILGGGEGLPGGEAILRKVIGLNTDAEIAIVCGNNMNLYSAAMSIKERLSSDNLHVFGFVDFVHSLLSISDIVITKCGASATMEILMMGKIPVISNYIWEQEKGNMEFVCSQDMGILVRNRRLLPEVINKLMTDREYYNYMSENVKKAALKNGLDMVTDFIINFQQSESNI
jgi:UDP-N-acetylglucosamine:LPS N-acetylglucosamine transferase